MSLENTRNAIILDQEDNVATMLQAVAKGELVRMGIGDQIETLTAITDIPFGHKVARLEIADKPRLKNTAPSLANRPRRSSPANMSTPRMWSVYVAAEIFKR